MGPLHCLGIMFLFRQLSRIAAACLSRGGRHDSQSCHHHVHFLVRPSPVIDMEGCRHKQAQGQDLHHKAALEACKVRSVWVLVSCWHLLDVGNSRTGEEDGEN